MTFDFVVMLVLSVSLVLVTIDCQHDANRVLYVKAVWPQPVLGDQAWTSTIFTKHALLAFSKYNIYNAESTKMLRIAHKLTSTSLCPSSLQHTSPHHALGKSTFYLTQTINRFFISTVATVTITLKVHFLYCSGF